MAAYLDLHARGELQARADQARALLAPCRTCPRQCLADRLSEELGQCHIGARARVASWNAHFGEEAPLVGYSGSGTIFFSGCNLLCDFCQNHDISHFPAGRDVTAEELAGIMFDLQRMGCHNINFVTPSHVAPQILEALPLAADMGLNLPLVYNSSGYDGLETLKLLDGVVDIYMPDVKFWDENAAFSMCRASDYPQRAREAVLEMHRQVGDLVMDDRGVALRGLLVRHLVMPGGIAGTPEWMGFLAREISPATYVNVMDQYRPCGRVSEDPELHPGLCRAVTPEEYQSALDAARRAGLTRLDDRRERQAAHLLKRLLGWDS